MNPTPRFAQSIHANLHYWQQRVSQVGQADIAVLDQEKENLHQAVQFGLCLSLTQALARDLALALFNLVDQRGYWQDWIPILEQAGRQVGDDDAPIAAKLYHRLGQLYRRQHRLDAALRAHEAGLAIARRLADELLLAEACLNLGLVYQEQQNYAAAAEMGAAALDGFTRLGAGSYWIAHSYILLGMVAQGLGRQAASQEWLAQAVALWEEMGHSLEEAKTLIMLANSCLHARQYEQAEPHYLKAEKLLAGSDSEHDKIYLLMNLGTLYAYRGQLAAAETTFRRVNLTCLAKTGQTRLLAILLLNLGDVLSGQGKAAEGESLLRLSLERFIALDDLLHAGNVAGTLAATLAAQGYAGDARRSYDQALTFLDRFPDDAFAQHLRQKFVAARQALLDSGS